MNTITSADVSTPARQRDLLHTLISDHAKAVLAYVERLLNDRHAAEDIVQETLIRAWHHLERLYGTEGSVRGWLLTVARNLVVDRLRSAAHRHETVGAEERDAVRPDDADAVLVRAEVTALLRQLPHEHREVLLHTYLRDKTVQETARILGIPAGTVKSRQYYALNSLRAKVMTEAGVAVR
ncbi:DNA-directed RNA polymerase sigma-70 factor [Streptomyces albiflavescens]|uniref:DNA-directed RNA polymerase sigma-70 factor n=1 Tax=Streptomyces albiflavescens TaxID=1623582 RepID=A0A917YHT7_9ACTN|nr:sigma-70 family RNA polymerase sigma factor [Streptomyces albiflavescens]GGN94932.1 DNA-directed RNA polymerase sigma-70 factor [Streptomyces albiflavescens]